MKISKTKTQKLDEVMIKSITIDYENDETSMEYVVYLDNGDVYKRGTFVVDGTKLLNNQSAYARLSDYIDTL